MVAVFWVAGWAMAMAGVLGLLGSTLLLLAVFLAGITLFSGLSWFACIDFIGMAVMKAWALAAARVAGTVRIYPGTPRG